MDKKDYAEFSRRLRVPQRCPLVGYCQRWAWTLYFYSYNESSHRTRDIQSTLEEAGDLPSDYAKKKVTLAVEPPECTRGDGYLSVRNLCPEVPLFDRAHTPPIVPVEAISSFSWERVGGLENAETKHFSQCLEFIQHGNVSIGKKQREPISKKLRFQVLHRDNFTCKYCGKSAPRDGTMLHVDHKVSVKDGGESVLENLVTSCSECNFGKSGASVEEPFSGQS
jgi:hypothetical protein